jgi:hypothetical protein
VRRSRGFGTLEHSHPKVAASRSILLAAIALLVLAPGDVTLAQRPAAVSTGQRVRVHWMESIRRRRAIGTVVEVRSDSLVLAQPAGVRTLALARLDRIDIRVPRSRARAAVRGGGLGLLGGFVVGAAVGGYAATRCEPRADDMCSFGRAVGGPVWGMMFGLPFGAIIGAGSPGRRWQRVR